MRVIWTKFGARRLADSAAQSLDAVEPNWWNRVNVDRLDVRHCEDCVLGQVYGNYRNQTARVPRQTHYRAFDPGSSPRNARLLNRAWTRAIRRRQRSDQRDDQRPRYASFDAPATFDARDDVTRVEVTIGRD